MDLLGTIEGEASGCDYTMDVRMNPTRLLALHEALSLSWYGKRIEISQVVRRNAETYWLTVTGGTVLVWNR